jgi:prophage antirepressor-like protein
MKNQVQIFESKEFGAVRTITIDGQPWFVGKDVASILGYENTSRDVNRHVDTEDKGTTEMVTPGGRQRLIIINESGLYSLILSSKLPSAKRFKRWVTSEILPSIRKYGGYVTFDTLDEMLRSPKFTNEFLRKLNEERRKSAVWEELVVELTPMALYCDLILQSKTAIPVTLIAKDYGMSAARFNRVLHIIGIQYRVGKTWALYQKYAGKGYTQTRTYHIGENVSSTQTCWT